MTHHSGNRDSSTFPFHNNQSSRETNRRPCRSPTRRCKGQVEVPVWVAPGRASTSSDQAPETVSLMANAPRQLVQEIESQAIAAQQQIGLVRTQIGSKQREMRLAQLTRSELATLPRDTPVYEGVGKMQVSIRCFSLFF